MVKSRPVAQTTFASIGWSKSMYMPSSGLQLASVWLLYSSKTENGSFRAETAKHPPLFRVTELNFYLIIWRGSMNHISLAGRVALNTINTSKLRTVATWNSSVERNLTISDPWFQSSIVGTSHKLANEMDASLPSIHRKRFKYTLSLFLSLSLSLSLDSGSKFIPNSLLLTC